MFKKHRDHSQSAFMAQEPLYQQLDPVPAEQPPQQHMKPTPEKDTRPLYRKKQFIAVVAGLPILLVVVLFVLVQLQGNTQSEDAPGAPLPTASPVIPVDRGPLQQRIDRVQEELNMVDPAQQSNPFPPVDMGDLTVR